MPIVTANTGSAALDHREASLVNVPCFSVLLSPLEWKGARRQASPGTVETHLDIR